jgi:hypothetical protein
MNNCHAALRLSNSEDDLVQHKQVEYTVQKYYGVQKPEVGTFFSKANKAKQLLGVSMHIRHQYVYHQHPRVPAVTKVEHYSFFGYPKSLFGESKTEVVITL